ncbi:MAG: signal peptidase [Eubacteriales bacterium]|nr:signal peptidase [Eubacteriales bacterium]MDN5363997.1 signal peptidase [Eubacteriales bacterium]
MPFLALIAGILVLDQVSKLIVQMTMQENQSIPVLPGIFHLTYVRNPGAAFGFFPDRTPFFIAVTFLILFLVFLFYRRLPPEKKWQRLALGLMVGGACGNLIDRLRVGEVIDFLDFRIWPVFNVADMAITAGVILLAWEVLRSAAPAGEKKE